MPDGYHDKYRLWVNDTRTLLLREWEDGSVEMAERETPAHIWKPPIHLPRLPSWVKNLTEEK